ncbi:MAG: hypothetical protein M3301_07610, partial [Chloroflexota bacterium]|nr:hypothetical protein [Chloroflexota bacterium]
MGRAAGDCTGIRDGRLLRELPLEERPHARLERRGPAALTTPELIALLWATGSPGRNAIELAADAVAAHGGLARLAA